MKNGLLKKYFFFFLLVGFQYHHAIAQNVKAEDLSKEISQLKHTNNYQSNLKYLDLVNKLAFYHAENLPDSAIRMLAKQPEMCQQAKFFSGEVDAIKIRGTAYQMQGNYMKALDCFELAIKKAQQYNYVDAIPGIQSNIGLVFMNQGNYTKSLQNFYEALKSAETLENKMVVGRIWNNIGMVHYFQGNLEKSKQDYEKMLEIAIKSNNQQGIVLANNNIGEVYLEKNDIESALKSFNSANEILEKYKNNSLKITTTKNLGLAYFKLKEIDKSIRFFAQALDLALLNGNKPSACKALIGMAKAYNQKKDYSSALQKSEEAVALAKGMNQRQLLRDSYEIKAAIYENKHDVVLALQNFKLFKAYADSLNTIESEKAADLLKANFDFSKRESDYQRKEIRQKWIIFSVFAALISMFIIAYIINKNRNREKESNNILKEKNLHIEEQNFVLEQTLSQLKSAQTKLIQAEKLASLGELTAGIAHEIQNPLNFVNNFSELSVELLSELNEEIDKGDKDEAHAISNDLKQNLEKISHHGKRASSIVKGMLEHSRASTGVKELTDINKLSDEYLRLSYHGMRAKDKSGSTTRFNADFKTDFAVNLPKIAVVPQDIGRVLLNLFNNAFYAVNVRQVSNLSGSVKPLVVVSTERADNQIIIKVKDNGSGMSEAIKAKIFQPFFTTKPTGEGTGLGLSLSYDIITKGHGGTLEVESVEGEGTTFIIKLPYI